MQSFVGHEYHSYLCNTFVVVDVTFLNYMVDGTLAILHFSYGEQLWFPKKRSACFLNPENELHCSIENKQMLFKSAGRLLNLHETHLSKRIHSSIVCSKRVLLLPLKFQMTSNYWIDHIFPQVCQYVFVSIEHCRWYENSSN